MAIGIGMGMALHIRMAIRAGGIDMGAEGVDMVVGIRAVGDDGLVRGFMEVRDGMVEVVVGGGGG